MRSLKELLAFKDKNNRGRTPPITSEEMQLLMVYEDTKLALKEGTKHDAEKPRMDLLDNYFLEGVASVLSFGAKKYAAHNWRKGIPLSRLIAAAYRHLGAFNSGEDLDPESGLPHLHHLGCCIMFLSWMHETKPSQDDRFISNTKIINRNATTQTKEKQNG